MAGLSLAHLRRRPVGVPAMPAMQHPVAEGVQGFPFAKVPVDAVRRWVGRAEPLGEDPTHPARPPALTALLDGLVAHGFPCTDEVPGLHEAVRMLLQAGADPALAARVETASGASRDAYPPIAHAAFLGDAGLVAMLAEAGGLAPCSDNLEAVLHTLYDCMDEANGGHTRRQQIVAGVRGVLRTVLEFRPAFELSDREASRIIRLSLRLLQHPGIAVQDEAPAVIENMPGSPFVCDRYEYPVASLVEAAAPRRDDDPRSDSADRRTALAGWTSALCARAAADPEAASAWLQDCAAEGRPESFMKASIEVAVQAGRAARAFDSGPRPRASRPRA